MNPLKELEKDAIWTWLKMSYDEYNQKIFFPNKNKCAVKGCKNRRIIASVLCGKHKKEFYAWQKTVNGCVDKDEVKKA